MVDDSRSKSLCALHGAASGDPVAEPTGGPPILEHVLGVRWDLHLLERQHVPVHHLTRAFVPQVMAMQQRVTALQPAVQALKCEALLGLVRLDHPATSLETVRSLN